MQLGFRLGYDLNEADYSKCLHTFLFSAKTEAFAGSGLEVDPMHGGCQGCGKILSHDFQVRCEFGFLGHNSGVEIVQVEPLAAHQFGRGFEEQKAGNPAVRGIGIRKMLPDVASPECADDGVDHRMDQDIRVRMSLDRKSVV